MGSEEAGTLKCFTATPFIFPAHQLTNSPANELPSLIASQPPSLPAFQPVSLPASYLPSKR